MKLHRGAKKQKDTEVLHTRVERVVGRLVGSCACVSLVIATASTVVSHSITLWVKIM